MADHGLQLFRGIGTLLTLEGAAKKEGRRVRAEDLSLIRNAAILEKDGRIQWLGAEANLPKELLKNQAVKEHDLQGATVMPALVECHTHLVFAGHRAAEFERRNGGESYQAIGQAGGGILSTVRATREAKEPELVKLAQVRAERLISQGVTTCEVKSGYGLSVEEEFKMLRAAGSIERLRVIRTFLGAHALSPEFETAAAYVDHLIAEAFPRLDKEALACRVDIFVENGYFDKKLAHRYLSDAKQYGFDLAVHADQLTRSGGAELAVELGARSAEHLICINESDIEALAKSQVTSVLLPSADLYMNCAYPPARALIESGARVALATDFNPGSSPSQDIALVGVLARVQMKMTLSEVIAAYTVGAASALGLERDLGSLAVGKYCDFCVLNADFDELFLEVGRMPVAQVYREGMRLY